MPVVGVGALLPAVDNTRRVCWGKVEEWEILGH